MHCTRKITDSLYFVGGSDRRLARFENAFPVPRGMSYNAYMLLDEKTALLDTVDAAISGLFFENLAQVLSDRPLDYVVVHHMEPDHCATLRELCLRHPETTVVCNAKSAKMIAQFFGPGLEGPLRLVSEGDSLSLGRHSLTFYMAPMVHWPEVMVSYEATEQILFSADAFGSFGALNGNLFADEVDFPRDWLPEARRYYSNIVGKYGPQVTALLKKLEGLPMALLCPLHGPVWRRDIPWYVRKYRQWSAYQPEETAVLLLYASIYGHTENAAEILAAQLAQQGVRQIAMYDVASTDPSHLVAEAFRCSHLVLCCVTHNNGIFHIMDHLLTEFAEHALQNRTVALVQNGSWAPAADKLMRQRLAAMKDMRILEPSVTLLSSLQPQQEKELSAMAKEIATSMNPPAPDALMDPKALFSIQYGLFLLTARENDVDNGCIDNTVIQVTSQPGQVAVTVNKQNKTHDMILATGLFNASILTEDAPFSLFQHFGFQSGKTLDKFEGRDDPRSANGLRYLAQHTAALLSGKVVSTLDCGTHTLFLAEVTEARVLSSAPPATYAYYFSHIKPKPEAKPAVSDGPGTPEKPRRGFVCKICGYFHEGDTLPPDFICPVCKHGAEDFEPVGF